MRAVNTEVGRLQLRDDETLVRVASTPVVRPPRLPDPIEAMAHLTGVGGPEVIGVRPPLAATVLAGNEDEEFRLFEALFGRDALTIARFTQDRWPQLSVATFEALAALQGLPLEDAPEPDRYGRRLERPGRIPHESRNADDPVARQLMVHHDVAFPYYFSDDATPMFVRDLARYALAEPEVLTRRVVQRDGIERTLRDALDVGIKHIFATLSSDHLLYSRRGGTLEPGPLRAYPVWQDSADAHFRLNGDLALGPVAMFEVQVHVFDALTSVIDLVEQQPGLARHLASLSALRRTADAVRKRVLAEFWIDTPVGHFVPGLEWHGGQLTALGGRKSTMGAALDSALLDGAKYAPYVDDLVHALFDVEHGMSTPWGIRTLGAVADCDRYRPSAYHNGNIWLFDNHAIALGLHRHGWHGLATWLDSAILQACDDLAMYPEFIRGDSARRARITEYVADVEVVHEHFGTHLNRIAQPPQLIQGWTLAAYLQADSDLHRFPNWALDPDRHAAEARMLSLLGRRPPQTGRDGLGR